MNPVVTARSAAGPHAQQPLRLPVSLPHAVAHGRVAPTPGLHLSRIQRVSPAIVPICSVLCFCDRYVVPNHALNRDISLGASSRAPIQNFTLPNYYMETDPFLIKLCFYASSRILLGYLM